LAGRGVTAANADDRRAEGAGARPGDVKPGGDTARRFRLPRWVARPDGDTAVRLTLVGAAIALQNLLELPREPITQALGPRLTGVLVVGALAGSLVLLLAAVAVRVPAWRWPRLRWVQALVLAATLCAAVVGVRQVVGILAASVGPPQYANDGTTLDHYAAQELLRGHNPYVTSDIVSAVNSLHQDPARTTPVHRGRFAALPLTEYPSPDLMRQVFKQEPIGQPQRVAEFESNVSYPALAFLPLVPLVWAGLPSVVLFFALCLAILAVLLVRSVPPDARIWVGLLILADAPLLNATLVGVLDIFYILLLFVAWRWWQRPALSTVALGLAIAAKQLAWFFLPVYAVLVWRRHGWREATARLLGAGAIFLAVNLPFIVNAPQAWLAGVLAPQVDPMFPLGSGLVRLSLAGILPLAPSVVHTGLELVALVLCVAWFWRSRTYTPAVAFVLAVLPLFFAWRSLTTYFYFVTLAAFVLRMAQTDGLMRPMRPASPANATVQPASLQQTARHGGRLSRRKRSRR
jgi:hypothetical protein